MPTRIKIISLVCVRKIFAQLRTVCVDTWWLCTLCFQDPGLLTCTQCVQPALKCQPSWPICDLKCTYYRADTNHRNVFNCSFFCQIKKSGISLFSTQRISWWLFSGMFDHHFTKHLVQFRYSQRSTIWDDPVKMVTNCLGLRWLIWSKVMLWMSSQRLFFICWKTNSILIKISS